MLVLVTVASCSSGKPRGSGSTPGSTKPAVTPAPRIKTTVYSWGVNDNGATAVPATLTDATAVAAGKGFSIALKSDGTVVGWGLNDQGQADPTGISGVTAIAAGTDFALAVLRDGTVTGWGNNSSGQLDAPAGLTDVADVAAGDGFSLALKKDGTVIGWGDNFYGQLNVPHGLSGVTEVSAGDGFSLALKKDGTVVAWGENEPGNRQATVPAGLSGVTAIAAGGWFSLALKNNGTVVGWGDRTYGQTVAPARLSGVVAIAAGAFHSLALKRDGTVVAWGRNTGGEASVPGGLSGVTAIAAGSAHNVALSTSSTTLSPVPVPGEQQWPPLSGEDAAAYLTIAHLATGDLSAPYLRGRIVIMQKGSEFTNAAFNNSLGWSPPGFDQSTLDKLCDIKHFTDCVAGAAVTDPLIARTPAEVATIVWTTCTTSPSSYYSNGNQGFATTCTVTVIDKAKRLVVGEKTFGPVPPPKSISCGPSQDHCTGYGPVPFADMASYLASLPHRT